MGGGGGGSGGATGDKSPMGAAWSLLQPGGSSGPDPSNPATWDVSPGGLSRSRRNSSVKDRQGRKAAAMAAAAGGGGQGGVPLGGWQCSSAVARARQKSLQAMQERQRSNPPRPGKAAAAARLYPEYTEVPDMWGGGGNRRGGARADEEEDALIGGVGNVGAAGDDERLEVQPM